ncbi:DUF5781 family protein [Natronobacterium gregoryi]|uniref:Uncharacterized protein n=2 Tax=Natronobacterium gregoryi TaxID=44930 RepID=L0AEU1_NATGS|nr:DUF5781 family protein [Natronobacterium gregoryi]AFZ72433.1 hypothetical protein Natgr_1209 [Natronobacterium gregoryi SP2]ELY64662.1 hypothetical protein C490_14380 [Natronobacterium gregoryi SP2]PLK19245.1 hypothetical protein CYV19_15810 [Natronobacterium gregoryi SP2]SFJ55724.1 hypothetical protein SAMN05443661_1392 [Natronobacterium gregoryi]
MDIRVQGPGPTSPFLGARDRFETEHDLSLPVYVQLRDDPDERTWAGHYEDRHVLNISRQAASSAMARELALHEFAHMARYEQEHPSHTQSTDEVLFLALAGKSVERRKLAHCHQIANHMKDIYADDITLSVDSGEKLLAYLESSLAAAVADRPDPISRPAFRRLSPTADPEITAVNAAFALALAERHDLVDDDHRLYDLAHVAAMDAPGVDFEGFNRRFRELARDPNSSDYRQVLVGATREYVAGGGRAAD